MSREAPKWIKRTQKHFHRKANVWTAAHYTMGFTSAVLAALLATNLKTHMNDTAQALIAMTIAGLSFLVTTLGTLSRSLRSNKASDVLEEALLTCESDPSVPEVSLTKALETAHKIIHGN